MDVQNQPIVITGGGSGLGEATARHLAAAGARVCVLDVNGEAARAVAQAIGGIAHPCDVTDPDSVATALAFAGKTYGGIRVAVSCAGIAPAGRVVGRKGPHPLDLFARVISVNLIGTFNVLRLAAAIMAEQEPLGDGERGVIINTASIAAFEGQIGQCAYAASKGGVASLSLPAARELAPAGIRVMAIAPGLFGTPMLAGLPDEVQDSLVGSTLFPHRLGKPQEYARLAQHIIENSMLNGGSIRLDGALRMAPT